MTCLSLLCLLDPSGFYVTASAYESITPTYRLCHGNWCHGQLGELKLGMRVNLSDSTEIDYGIRHTSYLTDNDRGEESAFLSITWRPFRQ